METEEQIVSVEPATSEVGFRLTDDDIEILCLIHQHRFLRREQISVLTNRHPVAVHRRLVKLGAANYVSALRLPQQKHIYRLHQAGVSALVARGWASEDSAVRRNRDHELKPLFLDHEMMLVDLHVVMTLASREGETRLLDWKEGRINHDQVVISDRHGSGRLPVQPDAFFKLEDSRWPADKNSAHFALEADRSTTAHLRFRDKMRAYWNYIDQGLPQRKFGVKRFRVLTVTLTPERARNLCALCKETVPVGAHKYFLFTSVKHFSLENPSGIFQPMCISPRDDLRHPLIPAPNQLQKEGAMV
jgi:protein involved in plasmid replication-relaxation